ARAAIAAAAPPPPPVPARRRAAGPVAHLLSIYDEYISSYRDRSAIRTPADGRRLVGQGNALTAVLVLDGQVTGTWKRILAKGAVHVDVRPFRRLTAAQARAVAATAARYARFLGPGVELELSIKAGAARASDRAAPG
ncbi:MAG TPA: crosslink repair DNA glycosylase YcaQ family protein, partial [Kofleriaceae bacterium]|nr:crosslink repair DNA glycosylase YcaQ family protein [Kofleriaceae bacterium]